VHRNFWRAKTGSYPTLSATFLSRHGDRSTPVGFSLGYFYEAELFRVGVAAIAATRDGSGVGWFGMDAAWLPLDGEITPYFGAGSVVTRAAP
jgi:hypothetical protein